MRERDARREEKDHCGWSGMLHVRQGSRGGEKNAESPPHLLTCTCMCVGEQVREILRRKGKGVQKKLFYPLLAMRLRVHAQGSDGKRKRGKIEEQIFSP